MSLLPELTSLGKLDIIEVYQYYDQPCLFSCYNESGEIFIALWVDETDLSNVWLYLPISEQRLTNISNNQLSLKMAFTNSETGLVHQVIISKNSQPSLVTNLSLNELNDDWLPLEGEFLSKQQFSNVFTVI